MSNWDLWMLFISTKSLLPSNGDWLLSDFLGIEWICDARRLQAYCVRQAKDVTQVKHIVYTRKFKIANVF